MATNRKFHQLYGPLQPPAFLGELIDSADEIENIAVVVRWKKVNNSAPTNVYWTSMSSGDAAWLDYVFRTDFMSMLMGDKDIS